MTDPDFRLESAASLGPDEPMNDEFCSFVLSLRRDGRSLHPRLVERAEEWADAHPECRRTLGDFAAVGDLLASESPVRASAGFTDRVLTKRRQFGRGGDVLPLLRRLSVAAALLLGLTLAFDMAFPAGAAADDELARQEHEIDSLRPDPFSDANLDAGLQILLPDPTPLAGNAPGPGEQGGDR